MEIHQIDAHLEKHAGVLKSQPASDAAALASKDAGVKLVNICAIWAAVEPVLKFAKAILFFKPKWQDALQKLMDSLDTACA